MIDLSHCSACAPIHALLLTVKEGVAGTGKICVDFHRFRDQLKRCKAIVRIRVSDRRLRVRLLANEHAHFSSRLNFVIKTDVDKPAAERISTLRKSQKSNLRQVEAQSNSLHFSILISSYTRFI